MKERLYKPKGYKHMLKWTFDLLTKTGLQFERYSTEHLKHMSDVMILSEMFGKKPIDVASDLYRLRFQQIEQDKLNSIPIGEKNDKR